MLGTKTITRMEKQIVSLLFGCILISFLFHLSVYLTETNWRVKLSRDSTTLLETNVILSTETASATSTKDNIGKTTSTELENLFLNESIVNTTNYITCAWVHGQGLGNHMFQYATLLGIAPNNLISSQS